MRGRDPEGTACLGCGCPVTRDEAAVTRKLIDRGADRFYCAACLAARFRVGEDVIREKIARFRETGCTLFDPEP